MERTEQHEIETETKKLFGDAIPNWLIFRNQPEYDYGVDGELEILHDEKKTGIVIKIQLKGSKEPAYLASGTEISFNLDIEHIKYYLEELDIPFALILCDVKKKIVFWSALQIDPELSKNFKLAKQFDQKSITVHIKTENTLPKNLNLFLEEMDESQKQIGLKIYAKVNAASYFNFVKNLESQDIDLALEQLQQNTEITLVEKIDRLIKDNSFEEADKLIQKVLTTNTFSPLAKLNTLILTEKIAIKIDKKNLSVFYLWQAKMMKEIKDKLSYNHQKVIDGYLMCAEVSRLTKRYFDLHINWKMHSEPNSKGMLSTDKFWFTILILEKTKTAKELLEYLERLGVLINELLEKNLTFLVPPTIIRFMTQFHFFPMYLRQEAKGELSKPADDLEIWIERNIDFAISILDRFKNKIEAGNQLGRCTVVLAMLARSDKNKNEYWKNKTNDVLNKITPQINQDFYRGIANELFKDVEVDFDPENPDWEFLKEMYKEQAVAFGVRFDLLEKAKDTPNNEDKFDFDLGIARIISIGITDLDAKPFFQSCVHFVYELSGGVGEPARMLKLPTARRKTVACIKHPEHGAIRGLALGPTTALFESQYCSKCPDKQAHDPDWIFSEPWLERQQGLWDAARNLDNKDRTRQE